MPLALRTLVVSVVVVAGLALGTTPASAHHAPIPPGRTIKHYTVKPGDTATGLAVRFTAWTDELIRINHLGPEGTLRVGQRIVIPRVTARLPRKVPAAAAAQPSRAPLATAATWKHADPSRAKVRRAIERAAVRHGVDPELALAVAWQESGWQMHHVSWASAIGAMQVLPSTGTWMSLYAGRPLDLNTLRDNVTAGVLLLKVLDNGTDRRRHQIAAYYQGLTAVRRDGIYPQTRAYVAAVLALKTRLEHGWRPE